VTSAKTLLTALPRDPAEGDGKNTGDRPRASVILNERVQDAARGIRSATKNFFTDLKEAVNSDLGRTAPGRRKVS
jgi:hypothetical protein